MTDMINVYQNPVIPGFFPDPSIVRVGEDYYLVTSSFEYFPAVPIFHSKDLVHWTQIGHVLTRKEQVDLSTRKSSDGIYACTLRYHEGTFYMVTTDVKGIGNFYVTAKDPAGPWSDPIRLPYGGIDPSLFFDDDGKVYVTVQNGAGLDSHIIQYEIDIETGRALTEPKRIWDGDGGVWTEGPHLYKINGMYYILSACGGTSFDHREIVGRSDNPYGPFEPCPVPVLTHNKLPDHPIQCMGHADLVEDTKGNWWMVFLGTRPVSGRYSVLGRETFLAPVTWTEDGWPMVDSNEGIVQLQMSAERLPVPLTKPQGPVKIEIGEGFGPEWSALRTMDEERYQVEAPGVVKLVGNEYSLDDEAPATFVGVRQRNVDMAFSSSLEFAPAQDGEEAGIAARLNNRGYLAFSLKRIGAETYLHLTVRNGDAKEEVKIPWQGGKAELRVRSDAARYTCEYSRDGITWTEMPGEIRAEWLAPEVNGGFTGVCVGLYASGNGSQASVPARFSKVVYTDL